jgi:hypothetical protein
MEVIIKLFLMRIAYAEPEMEISSDSCFTEKEEEFLEHQISRLEGKTEKQKNPYKQKDLKTNVKQCFQTSIKISESPIVY